MALTKLNQVTSLHHWKSILQVNKMVMRCSSDAGPLHIILIW